jgi:hypothetical protein
VKTLDRDDGLVIARGVVAAALIVAPMGIGLELLFWFFEYYWHVFGALEQPWVLPSLLGFCVGAFLVWWINWLRGTRVARWLIDFTIFFETVQYRARDESSQ